MLPFSNISNDAELDYLSDGITESIINNLSQLARLRVKSRSTMFRYKGRRIDPQKVGRDLNVGAVLVGRVLNRGDMLTIGAELVNVADGSQLWGGRYNRKISDIFTVEEEIATEISGKLRLRLTGEEKKQLTRRHTENPEAYQLYLKGRHHLNKFNAEGVRKAAECYQQAIAMDPTYALAHAGLADTLSTPELFGMISPHEAYPKAKEAARRALEIDETLAEAHAQLAWVTGAYDRDWAAAEFQFNRTIELNPRRADTKYSCFLLGRGLLDEGFAEARRAQRIEPLLPVHTVMIGIAFLFGRQYKSAEEQMHEAIELDKCFYPAHAWLGMAYFCNSMFAESVARLEQAVSLVPDMHVDWGWLGYAFAMAGRSDDARRMLGRLRERSEKEFVPAFYMAAIHTGLGEKDEAIRWLQKAEEDRSSGILLPFSLKMFPVWDPLRSDPRFQELLRRTGLSP